MAATLFETVCAESHAYKCKRPRLPRTACNRARRACRSMAIHGARQRDSANASPTARTRKLRESLDTLHFSHMLCCCLSHRFYLFRDACVSDQPIVKLFTHHLSLVPPPLCSPEALNHVTLLTPFCVGFCWLHRTARASHTALTLFSCCSYTLLLCSREAALEMQCDGGYCSAW